MSTGVIPAIAPANSSTRRVPRYKLAVPLALTVLRSGIPNTIAGSTLEIGEGGMGVVPSSRLLVGESVRVEFLVPHTTSPVRATAVVRYEHDRSFGLQFLRLPIDQQSVVRYWTRREGELLLAGQSSPLVDPSFPESEPGLDFEKSEYPIRNFAGGRIARFVIPILLIIAALGWWHWQRGWAELEAQVPSSETPSLQPQSNVPAEVMRQRIVHQVMPEYPEPARQAGIQGTVVLDAIIDTDGTVAQVKLVSGPEELAQSALDAVRWWRYAPYVVNGRPAIIETPVVVNFQLQNR